MALYVNIGHSLSFTNWENIEVVYQDINEPFDRQALVDQGELLPEDVVVVVPDLGKLFEVRKISFADIIEAISMGIDFVEGILETQPFYTETIPVINVSLADAFTFVDDFLDQLEAVVRNPKRHRR